MASAAMLRSAARSLRLRQPLEQRPCLLTRQFLSSSSSVPTERHKGSPSSGSCLKGTMEQKINVNDNPEDIYKRLLMKVDKISDGIDKHSRLLEQLEVELNEKNKHAGAIDLTPWVVSIFSSFLVCGLYNYFKG